MKSVKFCIQSFVVILLFAFLPNQGAAQSIFSNSITHGSSYASNPYVQDQTFDPNITVSGVGRGGGINGTAASNRYNATNWSTSFDANKYFTFTLTPNAGYLINFSGLAYTGQRSSTGPTTFVVRSSRDGFTSNIGSPVATTNNISLSASTFQGVSGSIEFRIYGWGGTNTAGTYSINDFNFTGSVVLNAAPPIFASPTATDIGENDATLNANITGNGGSNITERGFVWSTSTNPLIGGGGVTKVVRSGTSIGAYDTTLNNFPSGTRIYFKAYAINSSGTGYSSEVSFYTLSREPTHTASFTATTTSKNSIQLDWAQATDAAGYLIVQRVYTPPTGVPVDGNAYTANQTLGDGTVIAIIPSGATLTTTVNGLLQGTRYHYTLFPFGYNSVNVQTYNYLTSATIASATDSTWGRPTSMASTIESGNGEASDISSIKNTTITSDTDGTQAWMMNLSDGGPAMNDGDDLPTVVTSIRLRKGTSNTVANWMTAIESVALFDDSTGTLLAHGTVSSTTIVFSGFSISAADDNYRPLSVRITLEKRAHIDNDIFQFLVAETDITTDGVLVSSQKTTFSSTTDAAMNKIEVVASKLRFINQPSASIEAGVAMGFSIQVEALDTFDARDLDFSSGISMDASSSNLIASPRTVNAANGMAVFDTLRFNLVSLSDTLIASSTALFEARSNPFEVINSSKSDIVSDISFNYPSQIVHLNYNDPSSITSTNALEVFRMFLRDGGSTGDNDFAQTSLDSLILNVQAGYLIRRAALFQGSTKLAETDSVYVNGLNSQIHFGSISLSAQDEDSASFSLYVTFKDSAVDGERLAVSIASAFTDARFSSFELADAGAAASSITGTDNQINVVAQKLVFVQEPNDVTRGSVMKPAVELHAVDNKGNIDTLSRQVSLFVSRSAFTPSTIKTAISANDGKTTFSKLIYSLVAENVYLRALSVGLDSAVSDSFEVGIPNWYRSVKTGTWSDTATWEFSSDYGITWQAASLAPNYDKHGLIFIRTNDTVQMDGTNEEENTLDETIVEFGGVLITPLTANQKMIVNDADSLDMVIRGKLLHNNGLSLGGVAIASGSGIRVEQGGAIELNAFGDALDWAGNNAIHFDSGSYYIHSTNASGTISQGVMFPNAVEGNIPVFLINSLATYPSSITPNGVVLSIRGMLEISATNSFTVSARGEVQLRDGFTGAGKLVADEFAQVKLTGNESIIGGSGEIELNGNSLLEIAAGNTTRLLSNKPLRSSTLGKFRVSGTLDLADFELVGTSNITTEASATLITAHAQGLNGSFQTTGTVNLHAGTDFLFNGSVAQLTGSIQYAKKVWVNNSLGLTLSNALQISDTLFLGMGHIYSDSASLLSFGKNGVIANYGATSYIDGPLKMWASPNVPAFFPIGHNGVYGPITFNSNANSDEWVSAEYIANNPNADGYLIGSRGQGLAQVNTGEYWKLNASKGSVVVSLTSLSSIAGSPLENRRIAAWDGTQWNSQGPLNRSATATEVTSDQMNWVTVFTLALDSSCTAPAAPSFNPASFCSGDEVSLEASGNGTVRWFVNSTDTAPFASGGKVLVGKLASDSTFYTEVQLLGCVSQRIPYPITIHAIPTTPVVSGNRIICYNAPADLTASSLGSIIWYADQNGATSIHTGNNFVSGNLSKDSTFYAAQLVNGCRSSLASVSLSVNNPVTAPSINPVEACEGSAAEIRIESNNTSRWYVNDSTQTVLFQGSRFQINTVQKDTLFFVEAIDGKGCRSERVPAALIKIALPPAPLASANEICEGNTVQITTTSSVAQVYWYDNSSANLALDSGLTFTTPLLFADKQYYAASFDGKCYSTKTAFPIQVNPYPLAFSILTPASIPGGQTVSVQTDALAQNYSWNFGQNATPQTAAGVGPHNVVWSERGVKIISLNVWNGAAGSCSTKVEQIVFVDAGTGIEGTAGLNKVKIYPNPVAENSSLTIEFAEQESAQIHVFDATGKLVANKSVEGTIAFSTENWKPGIYFVRITSEGYSINEKIVVE